MSLLVLSEAYDSWRPAPVALEGGAAPEYSSPQAALSVDFDETDLVLMFGQINASSVAIELGGALSVTLHRGATAVLAFPASMASADVAFLEALPIDDLALENDELDPVAATANAFTEYMARYGRSAMSFTEGGPASASILGTLPSGRTASVVVPVGKGQVFIVPYHVANFQVSHARLLHALHKAVTHHLRGLRLEPAPHLEGLRLPGENDLLEQISALEAQIAAARIEATRLARHRQLVGSATGDGFEQLCIATLNLVLASTEFEAVDREDTGAEDFMIVGPGGDRAVAEAKGVGSHVRRSHVSQLEASRALRADARDDADLQPGLLLVNVFRNGDQLDQRDLPVDDSVIAQAARLDVLVMRGFDLYRLVGQAIREEQTGGDFLEHLGSGGGWLEVDDHGTMTLHAGGATT